MSLSDKQMLSVMAYVDGELRLTLGPSDASDTDALVAAYFS